MNIYWVRIRVSVPYNAKTITLIQPAIKCHQLASSNGARRNDVSGDLSSTTLMLLRTISPQPDLVNVTSIACTIHIWLIVAHRPSNTLQTHVNTQHDQIRHQFTESRPKQSAYLVAWINKKQKLLILAESTDVCQRNRRSNNCFIAARCLPQGP